MKDFLLLSRELLFMLGGLLLFFRMVQLVSGMPFFGSQIDLVVDTMMVLLSFFAFWGFARFGEQPFQIFVADIFFAIISVFGVTVGTFNAQHVVAQVFDIPDFVVYLECLSVLIFFVFFMPLMQGFKEARTNSLTEHILDPPPK